MKIDVLLGLQWGDEGKGKIVDVITPNYNVISRFQGGPNAGHTLEFNDVKHVLHTIPSGVFRKDTINVIGNGVVLDPVIFKQEIEKLESMGVELRNTLIISKRAHLILPSHRILDAASEASKGKTKIGSTLKGIGPTYMDKTGRNGLRVGDILNDDFLERYNNLYDKHKKILEQHDFQYNIEDYSKNWFEGIELMKQFKIVDGVSFMNDCLINGKTILAEGAQGTLLDIDFGTFPYVTSSNTVTAGACTGLGVSPNKIGEVLGICKAYCTRVGSGPFPTELENETGQLMRKIGHEYGATTGRERRCGWLDMVALKYAVLINGVSQLIITKGDVLSTFPKIKVAVSYKINNEWTDVFPYSLDDIQDIEYLEFDGWMTDISKCKTYESLPIQFKNYLQFIENQTNVPITIISVGPNREETIFCKK